MYADTHHYLLPLTEKLKLLTTTEQEELKRMQTILAIADETVKDVVARGAARAQLFEDVAKGAATATSVGISDNTMRLRDDEANILFSPHLSDPREVARTEIDAELQKAVKDLRAISRDQPISGVSLVHQRVAPLRSAMSVALKERDPGNMRSLAQHSNPRTQQRLANLKNAAKLFDALGTISREHLEPIERKMTESPFVLPFHVPFVVLTNLIRNELLAHQTGEAIEEEFNAVFNATNSSLVDAYRALDPEADAAHQSDNWTPTAKECFIMLANENDERRALHEKLLGLLDRSKEIERQGREFLSPTVERTREQATAALDDVAARSEHLRALAKEAREQLAASLAERVGAREEKIAACTASIGQLEQRAFQNRNKQEKAVRRMREEIKALVKLQQEHEALVGEVGRQYNERVEHEVTLEGLRLACAARSERLASAEQACDHSAAIAVLARKQLEAALAQCQAHISRATSQEFTRCSRIGRGTIQNAAQWYRCLGDLLGIRTQRLEKIHQREQAGGWQVQFLQKQENSAHEAAVTELVDLRREIEELYVPLSRTVLSLDVDTPSLKFVDVQDPETRRMRQVFLSARDVGRERLLREGTKELSTRRSGRSGRSSRTNDSASASKSALLLPNVAANSSSSSSHSHSHSHVSQPPMVAPSELPSLPQLTPRGASNPRNDVQQQQQQQQQVFAPEPPPRIRPMGIN